MTQIFDKNEIEILKAKYFPPLKFTLMYKEMLDYVVNLHSRFDTLHSISNENMNLNLRNLILKEISHKEGRNYGGFYSGDFDTIEFKKLSRTNHLLNNKRKYALAHEIGHLKFNEFKIEDDSLVKLSGLNRTYYPIRKGMPLDDKKSYILDVDRDEFYVENYGIDDFLNDEQTYDMFNEFGEIQDGMEFYNSFGSIIEFIAGKDVCLKARETHNIEPLREKFLSIIPKESLFKKTLDCLDSIFYKDEYFDKNDLGYKELKGFKLLFAYLEEYCKNQVLDGTFDMQKFLDVTTLRAPFELKIEDKLDKLNQSLKGEVTKFYNQESLNK